MKTVNAVTRVMFVCATLLSFNMPAQADRLDIVMAMDQKDYCGIVADQFYAGIIGKVYGAAREFKPATPDIIEKMEHGVPLPKDALYVIDWEELSDRDKSFVLEHVLLGYDEAAKIGRQLTEDETRAMGQAYFDSCMQNKLTAIDSPFRKVEALENVNPAKRFAQCTQWLSDHRSIAQFIKHGRDCDEMKDWTKNTEGVQDERRAKISRLLNEVCGKDPDAWYESYSKQCMGIKPGDQAEERVAPPPQGDVEPTPIMVGNDRS
jgi:hypothetical protein